MEEITQQAMKLKFLIAALLGIISHELTAAGITIGEMVVKIQDAATGKPVPGIYVYRGITTQYVPFAMLGIGIEAKQVYHPPDYAVSDSSGVAVFKKKRVSRKKYNEGISEIGLDLNFGFNKSYDQNDASAHARALGGSQQEGGRISSKNKINDALLLGLAVYGSYDREEYEIVKSANPQREYIRIGLKYNFTEPYKTIVIKLGNASIVENGIKTEVTLVPTERVISHSSYSPR